MSDLMNEAWELIVAVQDAMTKHPKVTPSAIWKIDFTDISLTITVDGSRNLCAFGDPGGCDCWVKLPFSEVDRLMKNPLRAVWLKITGDVTTSDDGGAVALGRALLELARLEDRL